VLHTKRGPRVEEEAAVLDRAAHHGVVELAGLVDGALRTRWVEGRTLAALGPLPAEEVAGLAAAVAAVLADLHDRGIAHGGLDPTHVLVTAEGRPVLCSLGRPGSPAGDVAALGELVAGRLAAGPGPRGGARPPGRRPLGPLLAPPAGPALAALADQARHPDPAQRPTARELADAIAAQVPGARLPRPPAAALALAGPARPRAAVEPGRGRRRAALGAGAAALALAAGWAAAGPFTAGNAARPSAPPPPPPAGRPAATTTTTVVAAPVRVWPRPTAAWRDGVLTTEDGTRYRVGQAGDVVVTGAWGCGDLPTVALLRPATGEVFAFDEWAERGRDVTARAVGTVPGAASLEVADLDGDGCADLVVAGPAVAPVAVPVAPGAGR